MSIFRQMLHLGALQTALLAAVILGTSCKSETSPSQTLPPAAAAANGGVQVVHIKVTDRGYQPAQVTLAAGMPARLVFDQQSHEPCVSQVHIPSHNVPITDLPHGKQTAVEFTPQKAGKYQWSCGMDMMHGDIVVKAAR